MNHPRLIYNYVMKNAVEGVSDESSTDEELETIPKNKPDGDGKRGGGGKGSSKDEDGKTGGPL